MEEQGQVNQPLGKEISAVKGKLLTSLRHLEKASKPAVYCVKTSRIAPHLASH